MSPGSVVAYHEALSGQCKSVSKAFLLSQKGFDPGSTSNKKEMVIGNENPGQGVYLSE